MIRHDDIDIYKVVQKTTDEEKTEIRENILKQALTSETLQEVWKKNSAELKEKKNRVCPT
jgi:hypothetical protein